jgi:hypothetical protein
MLVFRGSSCALFTCFSARQRVKRLFTSACLWHWCSRGESSKKAPNYFIISRCASGVLALEIHAGRTGTVQPHRVGLFRACWATDPSTVSWKPRWLERWCFKFPESTNVTTLTMLCIENDALTVEVDAVHLKQHKWWLEEESHLDTDSTIVYLKRCRCRVIYGAVNYGLDYVWIGSSGFMSVI